MISMMFNQTRQIDRSDSALAEHGRLVVVGGVHLLGLALAPGGEHGRGGDSAQIDAEGDGLVARL